MDPLVSCLCLQPDFKLSGIAETQLKKTRMHNNNVFSYKKKLFSRVRALNPTAKGACRIIAGQWMEEGKIRQIISKNPATFLSKKKIDI